jgi:lipid A 3-O-deacylase
MPIKTVNNSMKTLQVMIMFMVSNSFFLKGQIDSSQTENYFRSTYDNDFFSATDRYYTQGVRLELILHVFKKNPLSRILIPIKPDSRNYYGVAFERDGFTPRSIRHDSIFYGERPYAGISFLSFFLVSSDKERKQRLSTYLDLGIIGPRSLGAEEQMYIHRKLRNIQPLGWQYQIANDIIVNYKIKYEKGLIQHKNFELMGFLEGRAGTLYDDLSLGSIIRIGRLQNYFDNLGTARFSSGRKFQCYLMFQGSVKGVVYNATMQGGVFNRGSVYTLDAGEIARIIAIGYGGIVIAYKRISLEYTKAYTSREFYTGLNHSWGRCNISVSF